MRCITVWIDVTKCIRQVLLTVLVLCPLAVLATIPASIALKDLLSEADHVVLVQLVEGRMLGTGEQTCGARYAGIVVRSFKGSPKGTRVEFGPYYPLELGTHYLLFLSSSPNDRLVSTNSRELAAKADYLKRCKKEMAPLAIMHSGFAGMVVNETGPDIDKWIVNWRTIVTLPTSVELKETRTGADVTVSEIEKAIKREGGHK